MENLTSMWTSSDCRAIERMLRKPTLTRKDCEWLLRETPARIAKARRFNMQLAISRKNACGRTRQAKTL
jgi:hypothetical protein